MKQQEYTVISEIEELKPGHLQIVLNAKGKEGWKLVGTYNSWLIFMRDKLDPNEVIEKTKDWLQKNQSRFEKV